MNNLETIQTRYGNLSNQTCSLSCGHNLEFLDLKTGDRVLDLGCGKGLEAMTAARLVGESGTVVGLDLTPEMIQTAIIHAREAGVRNVQFLAGDMERLLFEDCSFDVAMSNCVINHARDKGLVYREIYRVLKPGGKMVISDVVSKIPLPVHIKNDPESWAACFGGAITEWEYLQSIRQAGFIDIDILKRREYQKNGYDFISLTIRAQKG